MSATGGYLISKVLLLSASDAAAAVAAVDAPSILLAVLSVIVLLQSDSAVRERRVRNRETTGTCLNRSSGSSCMAVQFDFLSNFI